MPTITHSLLFHRQGKYLAVFMPRKDRLHGYLICLLRFVYTKLLLTSTNNTMELNWKTDKHATTFGHPGLHSSSLCTWPVSEFGELVGYDMAQPDLVSWALEDVGYTCDAPQVCPDGRMNGQLHAPDYYAYSSPSTDSWQDGLQEIESFDWCIERDVEQYTGEGEDQIVLATNIVDPSDKTVPVISSHSDGDESCLRENSPLPDMKIDDQTQISSAAPAEITPAKKISTDAPCKTLPSPPWIPSPVHTQASTCSTTHLQATLDGEAGITEVEGCNGIFSTISELNNLVIHPKDENNAISTHSSSPEEQVAQKGNFNPQDVIFTNKKEPGIEMEADGSHTADFSSVPIAVETVKDLQPTTTASQEPNEESKISGSSQTQVSHKEDHCQVQSEALEHSSPRTDDANSEDISPASPRSRCRSNPAEDTLQAKSEVTVPVESELPQSPMRETDCMELPEDVTRAEFQAHERWQAQLQNAANETPAEGLSTQHSPAHREHSVKPDQASAVETKDQPMQANSAWASILLEQHLPSDVLLPPSPFQPDGQKAGHLDTKEQVLPSKSSTSPQQAKATDPRKGSRLVTKTKSASDSDFDAPPRKKAKKLAPTKGVPADAEHVCESSNEELEREKLSAKKGRKRGRSVKEVPQRDDTAENHTPSDPAWNLTRFIYGQYTKPSFPASPKSYTDPSGKMTLGTKTELQQPDETSDPDMEEHYSEVEIPISLGNQTPTRGRSSNTLRSRSIVSQRELSSLGATKYRLRPSISQQKPPPTARQLFAKPDTLSTLTSSTRALEESPSVPYVGKNTPMLVEDYAEKVATPAVDMSRSKYPVAKDSAATKDAKTKAHQKLQETPAARNLRKRKATPLADGKEEGEKGRILFPAPKLDFSTPKTDAQFPVPQKIQASTPRSVGRKTRGKKQNKAVEPGPEPDDEDTDAISSAPSTLESPIRTPLDKTDHEDHEEGQKDEDYEEDGGDGQDSDYISTPNPKSKSRVNPKAKPEPEPKVKNKALLPTRGTNKSSTAPSRSRTSTAVLPPQHGPRTPLPAPASVLNKYGFSHRKTRQSTKTAVTEKEAVDGGIAASKSKSKSVKGKGRETARKVDDEAGDGDVSEDGGEEQKSKTKGKGRKR